jgi:hypothetical protein
MSVQPGLDHRQPAIGYRLLAVGYWLRPPGYRFGRLKPHNAKKGALRLVQSALNPFAIIRIFQKSRRKRRILRVKSALFSPFSAKSAPFPAPASTACRLLVPLFPCSLVPCL